MKLNYIRHLQDQGKKATLEEENNLYGNTTKWANTV
jgi:hypothetical protein